MPELALVPLLPDVPEVPFVPSTPGVLEEIILQLVYVPSPNDLVGVNTSSPVLGLYDTT
jgi:hypothetical protein